MVVPDESRISDTARRAMRRAACTEADGKLNGFETSVSGEEGPRGKPALKPYWGKPAVRNFREDDGNVGIIRSPVRAFVLPDPLAKPQHQKQRQRLCSREVTRTNANQTPQRQ